MKTPNIVEKIDSLLQDYASPRARRTFHTALEIVLGLVALYLAYGQDWEAMVGALLAFAYAAANRANTDAEFSIDHDASDATDSTVT